MRRVYFSFDYERDIAIANEIRKCGVVIGSSAAGFLDDTLWKEINQRGEMAVREKIDEALKRTSVSVILFGKQKRDNNILDYEIEQSINKGNGIIGVRIDYLYGQSVAEGRGNAPEKLRDYKIHIWRDDLEAFAEWIEQAYREVRIIKRR